MDNYISFAAIGISAISLAVAYLTYRYSQQVRIESSQLRLVDQLFSAKLLAQKNIKLAEEINREAKRFIDEFESAKITEQESANIISTSNHALEWVNETLELFSNMDVGKIQRPEKRFYSLYVKVGQIELALKLNQERLEESKNRLVESNT
ncbi:hypothetical protein [Vibrio sp. EA2]|uniref:hypothetical protein n=1 Tax=Vibrio sp. EA2 TaxID=3079860 RepID=UPI0029496848|nr:hypothetical protein [Vibrio sp. EA2]MDV6254432.1 hypothetical protein [Vibrio sp. EA2]